MHNAEAWLVNTGWMGGPYGSGTRIDLPSTRLIINAILDGSIMDCEFFSLPVFNLSIPSRIKGVIIIFLIPEKYGTHDPNGELQQLTWL